jgi:hypothetical protein
MKVEKNNKRESAPLVAPLNSPIDTLNNWKKKLIDHEQNRKLIVDAAQNQLHVEFLGIDRPAFASF